MSNFAYYTFTNGSYTGTLTGYTPGGSDVGGAWLIPSYVNWAASAFAVDSSGRVYCTANGLAGYGMAYSSVTPPSADYSVEADFTCLSDVYSFSLIARMNSTGGAYCLQYRQYHGWSIGGIENGTISFGVGTTPTTGASAADMTVGQTIHAKLTVAGTTITATLSGSGFNGGTPITWSGTDATYTAAGNVGILANAGAPVTSTTGVHVTNFQASYTAPGPTTATVAGPTSGAVATASTYFTVTLNTAALTGGVSVSLASSGSGDSFGPNPLVIASGSTSGTFTLTPSTAPGARTITPTASGITFSPTTLTYTGLDVTPPVVATASVNTAGTTLTIGFTEAGSPPVLPASGATGFTLTASGGAVTLSSPAISGTTYTAMTSRAIYNGETLTLAYSPGNVTDSATSPNAMTSFSGTAVTNNSTAVQPLTAGVASFISSGPTAISNTASAATHGTSPYTYQWQRNTDGGGYSNLSGATSLSLTDSTAVTGHLYGYKCVATDSEGSPATATSNAVTAAIYTGGAIGGTYTDPGVANVLSGTAYTYNSTAMTGTLTLPTAPQTLSAVSYGVGGNSLTGTVVLPSAGQVQSGVTFGPAAGTTGTYSGGSSYTLAQIATAVWQDATAGDFTTAGSPGKMLMTGPVTVNVTEVNGTAATVGAIPPTAAQVAAVILATPAHLLATDASGAVLLQPTQPGVTIPTVTTVGSVTGSVGSVTSPSDSPGVTSLLATTATITGLYATGTVSSVTSGAMFTVYFPTPVNAAVMKGLSLCFGSSDLMVGKLTITTAAQVDSTHIAFAFSSAFSPAPTIGDAVMVI